MATVVTRYVNTASSGGDGTTNGTSGADAAYASLNAGLADIAADYPNFVTSDVQVDLLCTGTTADTTAATIPTITTDQTRFLRIKAQAGDWASPSGWSTSKYRYVRSSAANMLNFMAATVANVRLEGLQLENSRSGINNYGVTCSIGNTTNGTVVADSCRIRITGGTSTGHTAFRVESCGSSAIVGTVNCIFEGAGLALSGAAGWHFNQGNANPFAYNCLAVSATIGFSTAGTAKGVLKNCRAYNCTDGYGGAGTFHSNSVDNASDLASDAPGTDPHDSISNAFTDAGAGDFTTTGSDGGLDLGSDLSGDATYAFPDDMDQVTRSGTWDVGPYEYVAGASDYEEESMSRGIGRGLMRGIGA